MAEINDDARGTHKINTQISFKTKILRSSLCDYSYVSILVQGTITTTESGLAPDVASRQADERKK